MVGGADGVQRLVQQGAFGGVGARAAAYVADEVLGDLPVVAAAEPPRVRVERLLLAPVAGRTGSVSVTSTQASS